MSNLIYAAGDEQTTVNLGLATWGMDEVLAQNMILLDAAFSSFGAAISVNGTIVPAANLVNSSSVTFGVVGSNISLTSSGGSGTPQIPTPGVFATAAAATVNVNIAIGQTVVVMAAQGNSVIPSTIIDSGGNSYTQIGSTNTSGTQNQVLYGCLSATATATSVSFTQGAGTGPAISVAVYNYVTAFGANSLVTSTSEATTACSTTVTNKQGLSRDCLSAAFLPPSGTGTATDSGFGNFRSTTGAASTSAYGAVIVDAPAGGPAISQAVQFTAGASHYFVQFAVVELKGQG